MKKVKNQYSSKATFPLVFFNKFYTNHISTVEIQIKYIYKVIYIFYISSSIHIFNPNDISSSVLRNAIIYAYALDSAGILYFYVYFL